MRSKSYNVDFSASLFSPNVRSKNTSSSCHKWVLELNWFSIFVEGKLLNEPWTEDEIWFNDRKSRCSVLIIGLLVERKIRYKMCMWHVICVSFVSARSQKDFEGCERNRYLPKHKASAEKLGISHFTLHNSQQERDEVFISLAQLVGARMKDNAEKKEEENRPGTNREIFSRFSYLHNTTILYLVFFFLISSHHHLAPQSAPHFRSQTHSAFLPLIFKYVFLHGSCLCFSLSMPLEKGYSVAIWRKPTSKKKRQNLQTFKSWF